VIVRLAVGLIAAALAAGNAHARTTELARFPAAQKVQTLAIGGGRVFAATELPNGSVRLIVLQAGKRRAIGAFAAPIPAEGRAGYDLGRVSQSLRLAASRSHLVVLRTIRATWRPDCVRWGCGRAGYTEPLRTELYVARHGQRLRQLMRVDHRVDGCALTPTHVVLSGAMLAYATRFGQGSGCGRGGSVIAVAELQGDRVTHKRVFTERRDEVTALALAGSYVVWAARHPAPCPCATVAVADWRRGTTHFRFVAPRLETVDHVAVTSDAAVAIVTRTPRQGCRRNEILLFPSRTTARRVRARVTAIGGFVGTRLVHVGSDARRCAGAQRIALTDVRGRTRVLRKVTSAPRGLDFDGTYVVYALPLRDGPTPSPKVVYKQRVR
jgi:hypothetical protein